MDQLTCDDLCSLFIDSVFLHVPLKTLIDKNNKQPTLNEKITSQEENTPIKNEENTPIKNEENTPIKNEENTPIKNEENTPIKNEENIPIKNEENTPIKIEENTPIKIEENTPIKNEETPKQRTPKNHKRVFSMGGTSKKKHLHSNSTTTSESFYTRNRNQVGSKTVSTIYRERIDLKKKCEELKFKIEKIKQQDNELKGKILMKHRKEMSIKKIHTEKEKMKKILDEHKKEMNEKLKMKKEKIMYRKKQEIDGIKNAKDKNKNTNKMKYERMVDEMKKSNSSKIIDEYTDKVKIKEKIENAKDKSITTYRQKKLEYTEDIIINNEEKENQELKKYLEQLSKQKEKLLEELSKTKEKFNENNCNAFSHKIIDSAKPSASYTKIGYKKKNNKSSRDSANRSFIQDNKKSLEKK